MNVLIVDYYLDEWHANNYQDFFNKTNTDVTIKKAFALVDNKEGITNTEWAKKFSVELCNTVEDAVKDMDGIMILSPDNPEQHLPLFKTFVKSGLPIFVDKPFAVKKEEAEQIYKLADENGVKIFSSSALRFANEFQGIADGKEIEYIETYGPKTEELYAVHQLEVIVSLINDKPVKVKKVIENGTTYYDIAFESKKARVQFRDEFGYRFYFKFKNGEKEILQVSDIFENSVKTIRNFLFTKEVPFNRQQTLDVVKINEGILSAQNSDNEIIL